VPKPDPRRQTSTQRLSGEQNAFPKNGGVKSPSGRLGVDNRTELVYPKVVRFSLHRLLLLGVSGLLSPVEAATYSDVSADFITYSTARILWKTDTATPLIIRYGKTAAYGQLFREENNNATFTNHEYFLSGLDPDTLYHYSPCESPSSCDPVNRTFRTLPAPATRPALPALPAHIENPSLFTIPPLPPITGKTFRVASDCRDLQQRIQEAAAEDGALNHQILIPAGTDCSIAADENGAALWLKAKTGPRPNGTGEIIIRSAAPDSQLPPEGARVTESYRPAMATIRNSSWGVRVLHAPLVGSGCHIGMPWWDASIRTGWPLKSCTATTGQYSLVPRTDFQGTPPAVCTPETWYFKTDASPNTHGAYWCTAEQKLYVMHPSRNFFLQAENNAHHYRFFGIQLSVVPTKRQPDAWWSTYVRGDGNYYVGHISLPASAHHITFDRCYFSALDYPDRMQEFMRNESSYFGFINNTVEKISYWLPNANAGQVEAAGIQLMRGRFAKIINNRIETTGIQLFASDDADGLTEDVEVRQNTFARPERYFTSPYLYHSRHGLELKRGRRWWVDGNLFDRNYATVNNGSFLALSPRPGTNRSYQISDIRITNNIFQHGPSGLALFGHNDNASQYQSTQRIQVSNNVLRGINGTLSRRGHESGQCFMLFWGLEDVTIRNNICQNNSGEWPAFVWGQYGPSAGLDFRDNVMWVKWGNGYGGLISPGNADGTASLNASFPQWTFQKNLLVNIAGRNPATYPPDNFWVNQESDIGWRDPGNGDFSYREDSPWLGRGSDGKNIGVDMKALLDAQAGIIPSAFGSLRYRLHIQVFPNPWRIDRHSPMMTFRGIPSGERLTIFTVSGYRVRTLTAQNDQVVWDLTNDSGQHVASGLYLYAIPETDAHPVARGKFSVIR